MSEIIDDHMEKGRNYKCSGERVNKIFCCCLFLRGWLVDHESFYPVSGAVAGEEYCRSF